MVRSAVSQGIGVTLGLQDKFSWAAVAAAGVGSAAGMAAGGLAGRASAAVSGALGGTDFAGKVGTIVGGVVTGMADAVGNAAARSLIDGTDFGDNVRAALPSVLGNAIAGGFFAGNQQATADENARGNFIDRFSDGLLDGTGKIVKGIGGAIQDSLAARRTSNDKKLNEAIIEELKKSTGVGAFDWGNGSNLSRIDKAKLARHRMEILAMQPEWKNSPTFQKYYQDFRAALASLNTYVEGTKGNKDILGDNLDRVSDSTYLDNVKLSDASGYKAHLYYDKISDAYIFANAGTDGPGIRADVETDKALIGEKPVKQLRVARDNARQLVENKTPNLIFTGHSLGGALAVVQALTVNRPAVTFNSAPLTKTMTQIYG
ncbi:hypothetical protein PbB2_02408 [Candidatus Phycosocius bacilliformis]|uniref:Uncharacterized protein n=1 Tax=Candidatus Phycosocius bacilliformis TaxID=1445552 RepID=A0A2P2ECB3_9PROT|nr:lipase family protein [Candidatus Phycosocius bacilliformis]GBF58720.1 hypothetical protein PbB2_02408 [Candidatus Phycosocius bacilliformis]